MTWHKAWAQPSQGLAGRPCVGTFPKTVLSTCPAEAVLKVSNTQRRCKEETWLPSKVAWPVGRPDKWASRAQSSARTPPYSSYKYHGAPPVESVKKVRFSPPPKGLTNSIFVEERERRGSEGRRTSRLVESPRSSLSAEALPESVRVRWSFLSSGSVECGCSAKILCISTESRPLSSSSVSRFQLVRIPVTLPRSG
jgi:hypothetical protein